MLSLLLTLAVSQATPSSDVTPAPVPEVAPAGEVTVPPPAPVLVPVRSARLLDQPRVSTGALVGRVFTATGLGVAGAVLGAGITLGLFSAGLVTQSVAAVIALSAVGGLIGLALAIVSTAAGASFFGADFNRDLGDALPVAAVAVGSGLVVGLLALVLLPLTGPVGTSLGLVLAIALPVVAAAITPIIVQARKPAGEPPVMRDAVPMSGAMLRF